jgi:hypothetical protein
MKFLRRTAGYIKLDKKRNRDSSGIENYFSARTHRPIQE